jgi:hypothetical protein
MLNMANGFASDIYHVGQLILGKIISRPKFLNTGLYQYGLQTFPRFS